MPLVCHVTDGRPGWPGLRRPRPRPWSVALISPLAACVGGRGDLAGEAGAQVPQTGSLPWFFVPYE